MDGQNLVRIKTDCIWVNKKTKKAVLRAVSLFLEGEMAYDDLIGGHLA